MGAYRNLPTLFPTVPSRPHTASPRLGFAPHPKIQSLLSQEWVSYELKSWRVRSEGPSEQKPIKKFGEKGAWAYPGTAHFGGYPHYLRNGKSYGFQIRPVYSEGPSQQKPIKSFREKGAWAYPGTAHFLRYPVLSQERVNLRTSNFACTFIGSIGTKAH